MEGIVGTPRIDALLRRASRRRRATRAVRALPWALGVATLLSLGATLVRSVRVASMPLDAWLGAAPLVALLGALGFVAVRRVAPLELLVDLDRACGLEGRLASAYELARQAPLSGFGRAAIADAERLAGGVDPGALDRFTRPPWLVAASLAFALSLLVVFAVPRPAPERPAAAMARVLVPVRLDRESSEALRADSEARLRGPMDEETRRLVGAYNQLLLDVAEGRIAREEAMRRIGALSRSLEAGDASRARDVAEDLGALGRRMGRASPLGAQLAEALSEGDAARAAGAARSLADQLREAPPDRAALEALRRDLARAARDEDDAARNAELERRRREVESLLRRQREAGLDRQEESLLERRRRELERLERENGELAERRRELERLRRDLDEAARSMGGEGGASEAASGMDRAAEDLNRMAEPQRSEAMRQELERQLEQLREMLRRQREREAEGGDANGSGDGSGEDPMQRFVLRAGGEEGGGQRVTLRGPGEGSGGGSGTEGTGAGQSGGSPGSEGAGAGTEGSAGTAGAGGAAGTAGAAQGGRPSSGSEPGGASQELVLELGGRGGGGATLEIPGAGARGTSPSGGGSSTGAGRGRHGDEHAPSQLADPTGSEGEGRVSQVVGEERGGASRSEVILGAASRGFVGAGYRPVFADYAGHAEEILRRDRIPPGYRYYVRRYFQMIRPREAGDE